MGGSGFMKVEGKQIILERGTLVFLRPGQYHSFHMMAGKPLSSHNIYFDLWEEEKNKTILSNFTFYPDPFVESLYTAQAPCEELDRMPLVCSLQSFPFLLDNFIYISNMFDQMTEFRHEIINSLFYSWMLQWYVEMNFPRPSDQRIISILREIEENLDTEMNHEEWCEKSGLKKSYFYTLFKRETGMSLRQYIIQVKMKKAAALLQESDRSVTMIAEELGYSSIHYFTQQFTQCIGMSPTQYRGRGVTSTIR
jgi:AraC-like DNA-binding protein